MAFELPKLPYGYDALEPYIDTETMHLHHDMHHAAYVNNLNAALQGHPFANLPIEEVVRRIDEVPENIRSAVRNNGGGHINHAMFWEIMIPGGSKAPTGEFGNSDQRQVRLAGGFQDGFQRCWCQALRFWLGLAHPQQAGRA